MFDDFKDELLKNMPMKHTRIVPLKTPLESIKEMHSLGCWTAIELFEFSRENKQDTPALFLLPFDRQTINDRFKFFLDKGRKADMIIDEDQSSRYGALHIICEFTTSFSKDIMVPIIKGMLKDMSSPYYSFVSETWVVKQKKPYDRELDGLPSEHPDRKEKLIIATSDPTQNIMTIKDIEDGKLSGGGDYQCTKADVSVGRFSNLFKNDLEHTRH